MNEKEKYLWKLVAILAINLLLLVAVSAVGAEAVRLGDSGERVARIQRELSKRKLTESKTDGVFDLETRRGIMSFQSQEGIGKSGEADCATLLALGLDTRCSDCFSSQTELLARCIQFSGCLTYPEMLRKGTEILEETCGVPTLGDYITRNYPDFFRKSNEPSADAYNAAVQVMRKAVFAADK